MRSKETLALAFDGVRRVGDLTLRRSKSWDFNSHVSLEIVLAENVFFFSWYFFSGIWMAQPEGRVCFTTPLLIRSKARVTSWSGLIIMETASKHGLIVRGIPKTSKPNHHYWDLVLWFAPVHSHMIGPPSPNTIMQHQYTPIGDEGGTIVGQTRIPLPTINSF